MNTAEYFFIALAVAVTALRFVMLFKRSHDTNDTANAWLALSGK
jgi:hypothetical protein